MRRELIRAVDRTVTVKKHDLIEKLKEGLERHSTEFAAAKEGYKIVLKEELQSKIDQVDNGERVDIMITNQPPEDHRKDYEDAITMFEWAVTDEVELEQSEFQAYVLDNWTWKNNWVGANTVYLAASNR